MVAATIRILCLIHSLFFADLYFLSFFHLSFVFSGLSYIRLNVGDGLLYSWGKFQAKNVTLTDEEAQLPKVLIFLSDVKNTEI